MLTKKHRKEVQIFFFLLCIVVLPKLVLIFMNHNFLGLDRLNYQYFVRGRFVLTSLQKNEVLCVRQSQILLSVRRSADLWILYSF